MDGGLEGLISLSFESQRISQAYKDVITGDFRYANQYLGLTYGGSGSGVVAIGEHGSPVSEAPMALRPRQ